MTYTGMSSDMSYVLLMSSPSFPSISFGSVASLLALPCPAEQFLARVWSRGGDSQVLQRGLGLAAEVLRHRHLDGREQRAERPVLAADAPARDAEHLPVGRARRDPDGDRRPPVGRHLDLGAECQLGDGDWHGHRQVVAVAAEDLVRLDVHLDVQVTRLAAVLTGSALAGQADPLTVRDPR